MKDIETLKYINNNSRYVSINFEKLNLFLSNIKNWDYRYWLSDNDLNLSEKEYIIFAFICESMNFCFWGNKEWVVNYKGNEYRGAQALFYSVMNEISSNKLFLDINYLLNLSMADLEKIFSSNNQVPPLLSERFKLLKETINVIANKKEAFFTELFSIASDEELLKYIVTNFRHFDDKSVLDGRTIHFNKRAILLTNDLFNLSEHIRNNIKNLNNLTGGADYAIPRLLHECGILKYSDDLLNMIKTRKIIEHDSRMEIEIRSNTLFVFELMIDLLQKLGVHINSIQIDNIIWGFKIESKEKLPVHQTKTIYY